MNDRPNNAQPPPLPPFQSPAPVLGYLAPSDQLSDGQRVLAWMSIVIGAVMTLVSILGVAIGVCMLFMATQGGVPGDFKSVGLMFLVGGWVLLIPGYWMCSKYIKRLQQ